MKLMGLWKKNMHNIEMPLELPTEKDNWRKASINGIDSISPETHIVSLVQVYFIVNVQQR